MSSRCGSVSEFRSFYASCMGAFGQRPDRPAGNAFQIRLEGAFEAVPRELFVPPGPWSMMLYGTGYVTTPTADPRYLYQDVLVALDRERGINNGQPSAHARFMSAVAPQPGETLVHIGAGTGYYSAILSMLVAPGGRVEAFEIDAHLVAAAAHNLRPFDNVTVTSGDAVRLALPAAHVIYINAGLRCPPVHWLRALLPSGRMFMPWFATRDTSIALAIRRVQGGFGVDPFMPVKFIACAGVSEPSPDDRPPDVAAAWASRSLHLTAERPPDATATAVYGEVWFSSERLDCPPAK